MQLSLKRNRGVSKAQNIVFLELLVRTLDVILLPTTIFNSVVGLVLNMVIFISNLIVRRSSRKIELEVPISLIGQLCHLPSPQTGFISDVIGIIF